MSRSDLNPIYRDTFSSGDTKESKLKYKEENNNEVDELSKDLSNMGCIIDTVKKQPNICVETCVYESEDDENEDKSTVNDEDAYSDEFEEDKSDESVISVAKSTKSEKSMSVTSSTMKAAVKLTQSHTTMSTNKTASCSGRSTSFGSVSVPQTRRINMSFSNERLREIERHNHILLSKIMSARNTKKSSIPAQEQNKKPVPSAAVMRKKQQRQIDHDNMILLKKIQRAKSSAYSVRR